MLANFGLAGGGSKILNRKIPEVSLLKPPAHVHIRQGFRKFHILKTKFCDCRTYKVGPGSKKISYAAWKPIKVGWVLKVFNFVGFCTILLLLSSYHLLSLLSLYSLSPPLDTQKNWLIYWIFWIV